MEIPLIISAQDITLSQSVVKLIRAKTAWLDRFHPRLTNCRVVIQGPGSHHRQGGDVNVRIHLSVPGAVEVIDRQGDEDVVVAVREAFDAARRKLQILARRRRAQSAFARSGLMAI